MPRKTSFQDWVRAFGISELAEMCGVTNRTVYHWLARQSKPSHQNCILIMSRSKYLTLEDIVGGAE